MHQNLDNIWPTLNFSIELNMTIDFIRNHLQRTFPKEDFLMTIQYEFFFKKIHEFSHKKDILDGLSYKKINQS